MSFDERYAPDEPAQYPASETDVQPEMASIVDRSILDDPERFSETIIAAWMQLAADAGVAEVNRTQAEQGLYLIRAIDYLTLRAAALTRARVMDAMAGKIASATGAARTQRGKAGHFEVQAQLAFAASRGVRGEQYKNRYHVAAVDPTMKRQSMYS